MNFSVNYKVIYSKLGVEYRENTCSISKMDFVMRLSVHTLDICHETFSSHSRYLS